MRQLLPDEAPQHQDTNGKDGIQKALDNKQHSPIGDRDYDESGKGHGHVKEAEDQHQVGVNEGVYSMGQAEKKSVLV